jgi:LDH2 family malate/lactate/ureidoglycolate dehydrogenase
VRKWLTGREKPVALDPGRDDLEARAVVAGGEAEQGGGERVAGHVLTTLGFDHDAQGKHNDGCFYICWRVEAFMPLEEFKRDVSDFIVHLKTAPPAPGFKEILHPGECEHRTERQRSREGIEVEDATWSAIQALITEYGPGAG